MEIDTTAQSIDRCREYMSEFNAIIARYPQVVAPVVQPPAPPRIVAPELPAAALAEPIPLHPGTAQHSGWVLGWGVVRGQPPKWQFAGIYETHAAADAAAA